MPNEITPADVAAAAMIVDDIAESSDSLAFDMTVLLDDELATLERKVKTARGLLATQQLNKLESEGMQTLPDGRRFRAADDYIERYDHDRIGQDVVEYAMRAAAMGDTGEVSARRAAQAAVAAMQKVYTSPSTKAKVTPLAGVGVEREQVELREKKGRKVYVDDPRNPGAR